MPDGYAPSTSGRIERTPPYSEEAERGILGSILLDAERVLDLCIEQRLTPDSFYVPAHRLIYDAMYRMNAEGAVVDVLTVAERLQRMGKLEMIGGAAYLDRLVDSTPTAAHAEYYIDIVRQRHLLRCIIERARQAEQECYQAPSTADEILSRVEQAFLDITEAQHGSLVEWKEAVKRTMEHVEHIFDTRRGVTGIPTGFLNLDEKLLGLREGEMIVIAARPSMGKTSLAMNIAENISLGKGDGQPRPVGIFSLEMSMDALVLRMLCSRARVSSHRLLQGYVDRQESHARLTQAASELMKAPIYLDDTGGLDVLELRTRARRMRKKYNVAVIFIDYLQLIHSKEYARHGKQVETAHISGQLKAMAKELHTPVIVLSQLSRAPEQREGSKPRLSDLRDSGAIEQDADVVCLLRRPSMCDDDERRDDETLAIVDVAKQRNGPTGEVELNFEAEYTRFQDRIPHPERFGVEEQYGTTEPEEEP